MKLKTHYTATPGYTQLVTPQSHPVKDLDFGILRLEPDQSYSDNSFSTEVGLVILTGSCTIRVAEQEFANLGGRSSVFEARATGVYVPYQTPFTITATSTATLEIAFCRCTTTEKHPVQLIRPNDVVSKEVGGPGFKRYVQDVFGFQMQAARMIVGETYTVAGNWSSFPPHKHDQEALPNEVQQEELYLYKVRPLEGFGLQAIYSRADSSYGALDEAIVVSNDDVAIIPFGYHPVSAPPGYDVYYLWFLNGPQRLMRPYDDPTHAWIKTDPQEPRSYP